MNKKFFPSVKVCGDPGFDVTKMRTAGYDTLYAFFAGFETEEEDNFIGWNGIERKHPFELLEEIISVSNRSSLVESSTFITYVGDDFSVEENRERVIYPNGRCFRNCPKFNSHRFN